MTRLLATLLLALTLALPTARAQLVIPGADGSDGVLNITADTTIDLGQAVKGNWNDASTAPGKGVYDQTKWAIVFKYTTVTIAAGKTLTFKNHPSNPPVVWLVQGDVTINGTVSVAGASAGYNSYVFSAAGPGGFRGGVASPSSSMLSGGFGPGGGKRNAFGVSSSYSNAQLLPLIGGSGGGGVYDNYWSRYSMGSGGGGAILIATQGQCIVNGIVSADSGSGAAVWRGSGGGIKIVANSYAGTGKLTALGQNATPATTDGRIRIETKSMQAGYSNISPAPSVAAPAAQIGLWPPDPAPSLTVISVGGVAVPADPGASLDAIHSDVLINGGGTTQVVLLQGKNIPVTATVNVFLTPAGADRQVIAAQFVNGDGATSNWTATASIANRQNAVVQAQASW